MLKELSAKIQEILSSEKPALSAQESAALQNALMACSKSTAKALSEMIRIEVNAAPCSLKIRMFDDIPKLFNPDDGTAAVLCNRIIGTFNGAIIISSSLSNIVRIAEIFLHKKHGYFKYLDSENMSVIKELSTILSGYYITALNELLKTSYTLGKPSLSVGSYKMIDKLATDMDMTSQNAKECFVLTFETDFFVAKRDIKMKTLLLLKKEDIERIAMKLR